MKTSTANITTEHASKYLQQLCKHFGHKVPVRFTTLEGHVELPFGTCKMTANTAELLLKASANERHLQRLEDFIGSHLARFAFRESPSINWQRAAETT